MKNIFYTFLFLLVLVSCGNDDDSRDAGPINVTLTAVVSGTLSNSPKIEYRNASGILTSETLNTGTWNKTFAVTGGFNLFVKATGTINGNLELKASAIGNEINFDDVRNINLIPESDFDVEISTTL